MKRFFFVVGLLALVTGALAISGTDSQARRTGATSAHPIIGVDNGTISATAYHRGLAATFPNPADATRAAGMGN